MKEFLVCKILSNGSYDEFGIPVIAETDADDERVMRLFGIQLGYSMKHIFADIYENQYGVRYGIRL